MTDYDNEFSEPTPDSSAGDLARQLMSHLATQLTSFGASIERLESAVLPDLRHRIEGAAISEADRETWHTLLRLHEHHCCNAKAVLDILSSLSTLMGSHMDLTLTISKAIRSS